MTGRIDLDELEDPGDEQADRPNRGDWLWREDGDPDDEPAPSSAESGGASLDDSGGVGHRAGAGAVVDVDDVLESGGTESDSGRQDRAIPPRLPREQGQAGWHPG